MIEIFHQDLFELKILNFKINLSNRLITEEIFKQIIFDKNQI